MRRLESPRLSFSPGTRALQTALLLAVVSAPAHAGFFRVAPTLPIPGPALPRRTSAIAGDFNGDGLVDLAVSHEVGGGTETGGMAVFLGTGSGAFAPPLLSSPLVFGWVQGATADFNKDGRVDLAVASGDLVSVLLGDGAGHFNETVIGGVVAGCESCEGFAGVAVVDVDGDGNQDVVAPRQIRYPVQLPPRLWVRRGDGLGNFAAPVEYAIGTSLGSAGQLAAGDLNGDGAVDVAVAEEFGLVAVCLNDGAGGFANVSFLTTGPPGSGPYGMALADLNADGKLDLAVANALVPSLAIFLGNGGGGFGAPLQLPAPYAPITSSLVAADFDLDGRVDLALQAAGLWIYQGDGAGGFSVAARFGVVGPGTGRGGRLAATADLDADGRPDLAVGRSLLFNQPGWDFGAQRQFPVGTLPRALAAGDMNGDGKTDLVSANRGSHDVTVVLGNGDGTFGAPIVGPSVWEARSIVIADFDGDGRKDVALPDFDASTVRVLLGDGAGGLVSHTTLPLGSNAQPTGIAAGDLNGDGKMDLAVACLGTNEVRTFFGTGGGAFVNGSTYPFQQPQSVAMLSLNPDVRPDIAVGLKYDSAGPGSLASLLGDGGGGFLPPQYVDAIVEDVDTIAAGDVDGDGDLDLAVSGNVSGNPVLLGDGFGGFSSSGFFLPPEQFDGVGPRSTAMGDFTRDGKPDVLTDDVGLVLGYGDGSFGLVNERFDVGDNAAMLVVADFDGDGHPDVAAAVERAGAVTILLNAPPATGGADLSVTIAHVPDPPVAGTTLEYVITTRNDGPETALGTTLRFHSVGIPVVSSTPGPPVCATSQSGTPDYFVTCQLGDVAPGASGVVTAVIDVLPGEDGSIYASDATVSSMTLDLDPKDNSDEHQAYIGLPYDLTASMTDSVDPVAPGAAFSYDITVSNLGTGASSFIVLLDWLPSEVTYVSSNPPICGSNNPLACNLPPLAAGASFPLTINVTAGTFTSVDNVVTVFGNFEQNLDNNAAVENTRGALGIRRELSHGGALSESLPGGTPAERLYWVSQAPRSSYEVIVDATAGDVAGPGQTVSLQRLDAALTPIQDAEAAGVGPSRTLQWENASDQSLDAEVVRVQSTGCSASCGPGDGYRIRTYETTAAVPRFNTTGTQTTVLVLENTTSGTIQGNAWLSDEAGQLVGTVPFSLAGHQTTTTNLATVAPGRKGAVTISHDGPYGSIQGKGVAVEPATGFVFDTALRYRPR